jgi:hypothetical protein
MSVLIQMLQMLHKATCSSTFTEYAIPIRARFLLYNMYVVLT